MQKKNLIIISLRGGMDGLTAVPVIGDKRLKKLRKKLILEDVLNLNSDFGLHPKLEIFHKLWTKKIKRHLFMQQTFLTQADHILMGKI